MKILKRILFLFFLTIILVGVFIGGSYYGKSLVVCDVCQPSDINFSLFWTAYNYLKQKFVDPSKITNGNVLYGAISGMAQGLGDPYTVFFNPEDAKKFQQELSGFFEGIGVEIGIKKGELTVVAPLEGTPGQRAGLRPGDKIVKIDGQDTTNMTTEEAATLIRGEKGTEVTLTIYRSNWREPKEFKITRDTIKIPSLKLEFVDNNSIAHLRLYQFNLNLINDFNQATLDILNNGTKKIILDLRNNPGGYLEIAQDIAGWFLEKGKTVAIEHFGNGKEQQIYKANGNEKFTRYSIVVLINEGTASAAEILAGALKDNRNVKLIGEKSFGKGSVQEGINLKDGSYIKITVAKWLTPNGISISDKGLDPDVKVEITDEDYENEKDPQLDKAIEIVNSLM